MIAPDSPAPSYIHGHYIHGQRANKAGVPLVPADCSHVESLIDICPVRAWGETTGQPSAYLSTRKAPRRGNVLFTHTDCAYLRWGRGPGVRDRGAVFSQRVAPACASGEGLCRVHADHGRPRDVPCHHETSTQ